MKIRSVGLDDCQEKLDCWERCSGSVSGAEVPSLVVSHAALVRAVSPTEAAQGGCQAQTRAQREGDGDV